MSSRYSKIPHNTLRKLVLCKKLTIVAERTTFRHTWINCIIEEQSKQVWESLAAEINCWILAGN